MGRRGYTLRAYSLYIESCKNQYPGWLTRPAVILHNKCKYDRILYTSNYCRSIMGRKMAVTTQTKTNGRILYFDFLRIFATFAVMVLHVAGQNWNGTSVPSFEWQTFNLFHSITRFGVPIFVMISGALFLNKRELYTITGGVSINYTSTIY